MNHLSTTMQINQVYAITLRQWYAGLAMQGMLTNDHLSKCVPEVLAEMAFIQADAMLAYERQEKP